MRNLNSVSPRPIQDDDKGKVCRDLPAIPETVSRARRLVRETLIAWELSDLADDMTAVISEVVTNATVHARTSMTLSLHRQGRSVRAEVADRSTAWPTPFQCRRRVKTDPVATAEN
ncbi:ATP-binding protein [Nonomuraea sp. NPDC026600]|uniref:ATP-binding protein n=1 Tax=Nonomuraea sp. NPDC026600 TaxID=3155363 RepID=UPI0033C83243